MSRETRSRSCLSSSSVQQFVGAAFQQFGGHLFLARYQQSYLFFHGPAAYERMHHHVLCLADSKCPVRGLVLDCRVPPAIEVNDMRSGGQIESGARGPERENKKPHVVVFLEAPHQRGTFLYRRLSVKDHAWTTEHSG